MAGMNTDLYDYYVSQDGVFTIPIEALTPTGMDADLAAALQAQGIVDAAWVERFDAAFATYWERATALASASPQYWFPPRVQHVCVVTAPDVIRPYFQPFHRNSWLLYASDFDPETSSVELGAYHFLHVERMALMQELEPVLVTNLSYFLSLDEAALADFEAGCRRCVRPDAPAFHALADALPWVRTLHHVELRLPEGELEQAGVLPGTGLILTPEDHAPLEALQAVWLAAASDCFERHRAVHGAPGAGTDAESDVGMGPGAATDSGAKSDARAETGLRPVSRIDSGDATEFSQTPAPERSAGSRIVAWLAETRPPLLVTGEEWSTLWDPAAPEDTQAVRDALAGATASGEDGILADLEVVARCSRRFLGALTAPDELVDPASYITEGGLSYIHKQRKLIAYHIGPGENEGRLWQPSPPYERFMLAARTIHEWGHLAAESGWIPVPAHREAERDAARADLVALLESIYDTAPEAVQRQAADEAAEMKAKHGSFGKALLKRMNVRIEDYEANLLARRFLHPHEMDTYVRNNVAWQAPEQGTGAIYHQLTRHAYEVQYLGLSRIPDPLSWLMKSTWFEARFLRTGVVTQALFERLVATIGAICACYEIDETKFEFAGTVDAS